jgi:hypothetical protein
LGWGGAGGGQTKFSYPETKTPGGRVVKTNIRTSTFQRGASTMMQIKQLIKRLKAAYRYR